MKRRSGPDTSVRVGALIAVTLLHLPLIVAKRSRERAETDGAALLVRFIPPKPSTVESQRVLPKLAQPNDARRRKDLVAPRRSIEPGGAASISDDVPRTDWFLESETAARAAIDALIRDESYRPLGPREKRFQIIEPKPPPPLFQAPKHRSGDVAPNPMGYDSVWHNENCFTQLEKPLIPERPQGPGEGSTATPFTCLFPFGTPEPRGDLFEHLKKKRDTAPLPGEKPLE